MSALGQKVLIGYLVDPDALAVIAHEGMPPEAIPTEELRPVVAYALDYYFRSGLTKAPSEAVLKSEFGDELDDAEVDLSVEPDESIEWAIDDLKAGYIHRQATSFNKRFAVAMAEAATDEKADVLNEHATELVSLGLSMESRATRTTLKDSAPGILQGYEARAASRGDFRGMGMGLPQIDNHIYGVHQGELAVFAAGPKTGKSFWMDWVALKEWERGRRVSLVTLENSVEMTLDRIACMATNTDANTWMRGESTEQEIERVKAWIEMVLASENPLHVLQPDMGQRTVQQIVREAELREAESLLIDQLTFMEIGQGPTDRRGKPEKIGEALHMLKGMISTGRRPIACLMAHQINREGVKAADKLGRLEMYHLAEGSEVERTADFIFGGYQSNDQKMLRQLQVQMLGARRVALKNWALNWRPEVGIIKIKQEIEFE